MRPPAVGDRVRFTAEARREFPRASGSGVVLGRTCEGLLRIRQDGRSTVSSWAARFWELVRDSDAPPAGGTLARCPHCGARFEPPALPVAVLRAAGQTAVSCCAAQTEYAVGGARIPWSPAARRRLVVGEERGRALRRLRRDEIAIGASMYGVAP